MPLHEFLWYNNNYVQIFHKQNSAFGPTDIGPSAYFSRAKILDPCIWGTNMSPLDMERISP